MNGRGASEQCRGRQGGQGHFLSGFLCASRSRARSSCSRGRRLTQWGRHSPRAEGGRRAPWLRGKECRGGGMEDAGPKAMGARDSAPKIKQ